MSRIGNLVRDCSRLWSQLGSCSSAPQRRVEEVALMNRADRQKILVEGAQERRQSFSLHDAHRRSSGTAGQRRLRKRVSVSPSGIFPRQCRASGAKDDGRVSSEEIRGRYYRRHGLADHGAAGQSVAALSTRRCLPSIPPSSRMPRVFGVRRIFIFSPPATTRG